MHASVTIPALFSILFMFTIGYDLGNVFLGIPHRSAILTSTKFSVAPLSISVFAVAIPQIRSKTTSILREFLWLMYTQSKDMAYTQATRVKLSKKIKMVDHLGSTCPAVEFFCYGSVLAGLNSLIICDWQFLFLFPGSCVLASHDPGFVLCILRLHCCSCSLVF